MSTAIAKRSCHVTVAPDLRDRLDPDLAEAVKSHVDFRLGGNIAEPDGKGGDVVLFGPAESFETWRLPALIDADTKQRAALAFQNLRAELAPPSIATLKDWISGLGTLCATRPDVAKNSQIITAVYAKQLLVLNLPEACFTEQTLSDATVHFTWFPSFGELRVFLLGVAAPMRKTLERLKAIRDADERDLRGTFDYHTREERAAFWEADRKRRLDEANKRYGVDPDKLNAMSKDEALKAAYLKAGVPYPGAEEASAVKLAAAGMSNGHDKEGRN